MHGLPLLVQPAERLARRFDTDITRCSESGRFDAPELLRPTITATPGKKRSSTCSGNDLKPRMRSALRCTGYPFSSSRPSASRAAACSEIFLEGPLPVPSTTPSTSATVVKRRRCGGPSESISS
jgi:hypothetical protein